MPHNCDTLGWLSQSLYWNNSLLVGEEMLLCAPQAPLSTSPVTSVHPLETHKPFLDQANKELLSTTTGCLQDPTSALGWVFSLVPEVYIAIKYFQYLSCTQLKWREGWHGSWEIWVGVLAYPLWASVSPLIKWEVWTRLDLMTCWILFWNSII